MNQNLDLKSYIQYYIEEKKAKSMLAAKSTKPNVGDPNYRITNNNEIDVHVGRRVRMRRTFLGISQE